jgi:histidinol-phosphatase (PHP family)
LVYNLHTHTRFSDGSSEPEDYVKEAIRQGFHTLGFSDHSPVPFENTFAIRKEKLDDYVNTVTGMRDRYPSLQILLALEMDYIPGMTKSIDSYRKLYPFDYFIGSVHLVKNPDTGELWFIDGPDISIYDNGLREFFSGDVRKAVTTYYRQVQEMVVTQKPDIIGHLDKIRMYNRGRYFLESDPWYQSLVDETLRTIRDEGCVVEVNTRGIYKKRSDALFPGPAILEKINKLNIPVVISSDAHKPQELSMGFDDAGKLLVELGFTGTWLWNSGSWVEISL